VSWRFARGLLAVAVLDCSVGAVVVIAVVVGDVDGVGDVGDVFNADEAEGIRAS
jgi:hypothetical protein